MCGLRADERCGNDTAVIDFDAGLIHQQLDLADVLTLRKALTHHALRLVVTADDLLLTGFTACLVIDDRKACHINAHIRRALVRGLAVDLLEDRIYDREDLDVTVVVNSGLAIGLEVERVDHIYIGEVRSCCLISDIHRVSQRQAPDRECLELRISGFDASSILVIQLGEAGRHLSSLTMSGTFIG